MDELRERIQSVVREGSDGEMRDAARLAIAAFGRQGEGSGVIGVDVQRIRRSLELKGETPHPDREPDPDTVPQDRLREFERHLRRELERGLIERTQSLPPAKPLSEFDRALPSGPLQDLAAVHRTVMLLKRTAGDSGPRGARAPARRRRRRAPHDARVAGDRRRAGCAPLPAQAPAAARSCTCCATCRRQVTSASVFFLSVLHALHDAFRKLRLFVFVERIAEVTEIFERERSFKEISHAIATEPGVADVSGYTDYGRVWLEFHDQIVDDLDPRSTVIVLGDARTNGREPQARAFGRVSEHAGRTFWLNPEPRLYWNYGDSVMRAYEPFCDGVFECWTTKQLEQFVNALTDPHAVPPTAR